MKILTLVLLFVIITLAQTKDSLLADITEIASLNSDEIQTIPILNDEFTDATGYQTEWMELNINFEELLEANMRYCLVFDKSTRSFAMYFAYTGRAWSQIERAIFKFRDISIIKTLEIGKRKILVVGLRLRQYFSTDWFSLSDFLYQFITTGSVMINFTGLKWNLTTNIIPQTNKILLAKFYLKMMAL